jgi:hypothetical protein
MLLGVSSSTTDFELDEVSPMGRDGDASMPAKFAADCARKVWKGVAEKWMASGWASEVYCSLFIWITERSEPDDL